VGTVWPGLAFHQVQKKPIRVNSFSSRRVKRGGGQWKENGNEPAGSRNSVETSERRAPLALSLRGEKIQTAMYLLFKGQDTQKRKGKPVLLYKPKIRFGKESK